MPGPSPRRCAVLGDPVAHSLSPALHTAAYAELGLDWTYGADRVVEGGLARHVGALDAGWRGLSVTAPLKREALALADVASDRARLAGGANTLVLTGTEVHADNTDLPGAVAALGAAGVRDVARVAVLGAGSTAASVGLAACELGAREVTVWARSPQRAQEAVATIRAHPSGPRVTLRSLEELGVGTPLEDDLVVTTVPAAAQTAAVVERCVTAPALFEVLYDPWPTPLAVAAAAAGRVVVGGLDLLVHQAALQLSAFTGLPAPLEAMHAAGVAALAARPEPSQG